MASIRALANCAGIDTTGNFSVLGDFFGFRRSRVPADEGLTGTTTSSVSLLQLANDLDDDFVNLNIVKIGADQFVVDTNPATSLPSNDHFHLIDYCIYRIRNIYRQRGVGVGRILHFSVDTADAQGHENCTTKGEMEDITDTWTVNNDGIDTFVPIILNVPSGTGVILGRSAVNGPCEDKDDKGMNGSVFGLWGPEQASRTFAHEVGHYLKLKHKNSTNNNLMQQSGSVPGGNMRTSVNLTNSQGNDMKSHCLMNSGC
ncbi:MULTISPECIES: hypothetical protein [Altibacter]|uniref:hypothetical protein n=1 Tax=Altibacter TaxID=1535231 RepID=UPI00054EA222|nr:MULTISPECIES: hypothetical protein [Altibacter]MCW8981071.1 hypothetical protein [Altibacter sp.]MCW9037073.1 hypothetical protein [Altibacter sp.]